MADEIVETEGVGGGIADEVEESIAEDDAGGAGGGTDDAGEGSSAGEAGSKSEGEGGKNADGQGEQPYTLSAPEGFPIPEENLKSFCGAAHKAGLTKEQAEAMLGWHRELHEKTAQANEARAKAVYAEWDKEIHDDPKYGGQHYKASFAKARKGVAFGEEISPGFRKFLVDTGADKNPHVFRIACELGMLTNEDGIVGGSKGRSRSDIPLENRLWPDM